MLSAEVYAPKDLHDDVEGYADENDLSIAGAWRELARYGLQSQSDRRGDA